MNSPEHSGCPEDLPGAVLQNALVPEHSLFFMQAMSGGRAFLERGFLFLHADDWLMGIGYPLAGKALTSASDVPEGLAGFNPGDFDAAFAAALARTGAAHCYAMAPELPQSLRPHIAQRDRMYLLPATAQVPPALRRPTEKAALRLRVTEDRLFTPEHRRLWAEFLERVSMRPSVRELYARTEAVLAAARASSRPGQPERAMPDVRLLSAWTEDGRLCASLLLDYSPAAFCSYIIGAHSRRHYSPHATDLLFRRLLEKARQEGKILIHLGLGVNDGIRRFKEKWGGQPLVPYAMAAWQAKASSPAAPDEDSGLALAVTSLLRAPPGASKQQIFDTLPQQRPFAMLFSVEKNGARSWLCGSAHFFRYSFELAFRDLFAPLHTVIFEGPLDEEFLKAVEQSGKNPDPGSPRVLQAMTPEDLPRLERAVNGPRGPLLRLLGLEHATRTDVRALLADTRPWFAFFSLWVAYLERQGWHESVDLEAWRTAKDMGKAVLAMENLEEQLDSLESVPIGRIVDFFRRCEAWSTYSKRNVRAYLNGDLKEMMGSSVEFPSRTERVIDRRDERFRQRMRPFLESGGCAVFVGTAHLLGLIPMLRRDGFTVRPHYPTWRLAIRARLRPKAESSAL